MDTDHARRRPRRIRRHVALTTAGAVLLSVAGGATASATLLPDGTFEDGLGQWTVYGDAGVDTSGGELCVTVPPSANPWDTGIVLNGVAINEGTTYELGFAASASVDTTVRALVGQNGDPFGTVLDVNPSLGSDREVQSYSFTANASYPDTPSDEEGPEGQVAIQVGGKPEAYTICLDDIALSSDVELLPHTDFGEGLGPWGLYGNAAAPVFADGQMCVDFPGGHVNPWDAGLTFNGVPIDEGENYVLSFTAGADPTNTIRVIVGEGGGAFRTVEEQFPVLAPEPATQTFPFTSTLTFPPDGDAPGQVAFHLGKPDPYTFCISEVSLLTTATPPPPYEPDTGPRVRVNQHGYLPDGPKRATLVTDATDPVAWTLTDVGGTTVASGETVPAGIDPNSTLGVHLIDFGGVTATGSGFVLSADGESSHPFDIDAAIYQQLRYDALNYFYLARSGIEIDAAIVGDDYARPAGHIGTAPNLGDVDVPCIGPRPYYPDWSCDYRLDVVGGWYDAGDHGKYVVNGGIAVAQVLGTYERALHAPTGDPDALGDATLDLPERGNGVPDVLDEARWELEWMLSMQVPASDPLAGMVHHKIHDEGWTGLPLLPHQDGQVRSPHRPSTAATLNLAAVAAQGARLFEPYDPGFSATLLDAARTAWTAAHEHPDLFAPVAAGADGGGPYDDDQVSDEFYWAAAELFLTTSEQEFADFVLASPLHTDDIFGPSGFDWKFTATLGRLDLATVPNDLPGVDAVRASIVAGAEEYLASQAAEAFATTYTPSGPYEWGSNSMVVNNQVVLATAFDLTGDHRFRVAVIEAMDYLLGRNPLNNSYITGYGDVYSKNQHSRWYANQLEPSLPNPPPGSLAGGPNSTVGTWDPTMQATFVDGCAPSMCYLDHIQSWASNEITVNWNSALSWVASWLADQHGGAVEPPAEGEAPVVTEQPRNAHTALGRTATFTAAASGEPAPTVQWQWRFGHGRWHDLPGATSTTLKVKVTPFHHGKQYRAVFTNEHGEAISDTARLTVKFPPIKWPPRHPWPPPPWAAGWFPKPPAPKPPVVKPPGHRPPPPRPVSPKPASERVWLPW